MDDFNFDSNGFDGAFNFDDSQDGFGFDNSQNSNNAGFGFDSSQGGDPFAFDSDSNGTNQFGFDNDSMQNQGQNTIPDNAFAGQFDNTDFSNQQPVDDGGTKKKAIIAVVIGIIGICIVFFLATKINKATQNSGNNNNSTVQNQQQQQPNNNNVNDLMSSGNQQQQTQPQQPQQSTVVTTVTDSGFNWTEITSDEVIEFTDNYIEATFTITDIKHYARSVDVNNNLVVKTTLIGSISGLSGTYTLDIPYSKGISPNLGIGSYFTVKVHLGTYNGRKVVDEIIY